MNTFNLILFVIFCRIGSEPPGWTCESFQYDDSEICHCDCGVYDVDCDIIPDLTLQGCPSTAIGCNKTTAKCIFPEIPPTGWECDTSFWKDGVGCDCECGEYDPDCYNTELPIHRCASHVIECKYSDGSCVYDYPTEPTEWICSRYSYNSSDSCDCNCGAFDPDCLNTSLPITGCGNHVVGCSQTGHCIFNSTPPPEWDYMQCHIDWYGNDEFCDCNCGAYDPDCEDHQKQLYGCHDEENEYNWCGYDGSCIFDPDFGDCDSSKIDDGSVCNCGCGKYDPDCDESKGLPIAGCSISAVGCDGDGKCVYPPPSGWNCPNENYNSGDGCHCGCGVFDLDCYHDVANSEIIIGCDEKDGEEWKVSCGPDGYCLYFDDSTSIFFEDPEVYGPSAAALFVTLLCCCCCCVFYFCIIPFVLCILCGGCFGIDGCFFLVLSKGIRDSKRMKREKKESSHESDESDEDVEVEKEKDSEDSSSDDNVSSSSEEICETETSQSGDEKEVDTEQSSGSGNGSSEKSEIEDIEMEISDLDEDYVSSSDE